MILEESNAKAGKIVAGGTAFGNYVVDSRNKRGNPLVYFAENHEATIMNTFLDKKAHK